MELTELIKDYVATELLSSIELDFLEGELWETTQHIAEINTVFKAPKKICEKLDLDEKSCWQLCCAAVLDSSRPLRREIHLFFQQILLLIQWLIVVIHQQ